MKGKLLYLLAIVIILTSDLFLKTSTFRPSKAAFATPTLYIDPQTTIAEVDETFSINVSVAEVTDLCGWEFKVYYLNNILNVTEVTEGPFLKTGGPTYFTGGPSETGGIWNDYNATHGRIYVWCTLLGEIPGVNGSGVLAKITFHVMNSGQSSLALSETFLINSNVFEIPHETIDGTVSVEVPEPPVASFTHLPESPVVGETVTFDASASHDPDGFIVSYAWDFGDDTPVVVETNPIVTHNFTAGTYDVTLTVTDNEGLFDSTTIALGIGTLLGDVNRDGIVDIFDVVIIAKAFGSNPEDPNWNSDADLNNDGVIDIYDIVIVAIHFGESLP